MDHELALGILLSGKSALVTGAAGTGKTYLLNQFIKRARAMGKKVSVTATTGLAATHLNGNTIHSWSGMGIYDDLPDHFFDKLSKTRRDTILKTDILVIDEISMMHDFRLDMLDDILRVVRAVDKPFGGVQLVMSGDFFQLPPVNRGDSRQGSFVVFSQSWQMLSPVVIYLEEQFRQEDEVLLDILTAMRSGDVRRHQAEALLERTEITPPEEDITELHTTNIDVDKINLHRLKQIDDDDREYQQTSTGSSVYVESLKRSVLAPEILVLRRGALVMAVKNSSDKQYVNGSVGVVVNFEPLTEYPVVKFRNGREITMVPDTWELRDGEQKRASISQVPLRLAWAITVHKSQGMTLDAVKIDLRKAFVEGMGYVALSRVRDINHLYLYGINRKALEVSQDALAIDETLRQSSLLSADKFKDLRKNSDRGLDKLAKPKRNTGWREKIEKMRETHPNAFRPWTNQQDELLKLEFLGGANIDELSHKLGRHEGSIVVRLKKHFGDDVVA